MAYDPQNDPFHEEVPFSIILLARIGPGELNVAMKSKGIRLYYDVYAMPRDDKKYPWQAETYANIDTYLNGVRSDAQEGCDLLVVSYPLATIDAAFIPRFADLVTSLSGALRGHVEYYGEIVGKGRINQILTQHATDLMTNWGEEPGSRALRVLIETNRKRQD